MEAQQRYSPLSWTAAVAISACGWAATFNQEALSIAAFWLAVAAVAAWILVRWTTRFTRRVPAGESREPAVLRAIAWLGFLPFALWTALGLGWAILLVYPEPATNRAYAESLGIEFGQYFFLALALGATTGILAAAGIRALGQLEPQRAWPLRLALVAAPAGWAALAITLSSVIETMKAVWSEFGADLPGPTLFVIGSEDYLMLTALTSLFLLALAWGLRARPRAFRRIAVAQMLLSLACSACFTLAVVAGVLPLFKACGAV